MDGADAYPRDLAMKEPVMAVDPTQFDVRALRGAFGAFMTGVTVTTTKDVDGTPRGFTANSFTSVSLDPPLLLVCLSKTSSTLATFRGADAFAVNVLAETQQEIANTFASKVSDRFAQIAWRDGPAGGAPILEGAAAWFDCAPHQMIDAGDHVILIGEVKAFDATDANGLGYARGGYFTLGLEQKAVAAAAGEAHVVVGAIVEHDGKVLLVEDETGGLRPPSTGRDGERGSVARLKNTLFQMGVDARLGPLYAVYENDKTGVQSIYYRAAASAASADEGRFIALDEIPWSRLPSQPLTDMLSRFEIEHREQRFGVYFSGGEFWQARRAAGDK